MGWLSDLWKYGFTAEQRARSRGAKRYVQAITAYEQELAGLPAPDARAQAERVVALGQANAFFIVSQFLMP